LKTLNLFLFYFSHVTRADYELFCSNLFHLACDIGLNPACRHLGIKETRGRKIASRRQWKLGILSRAIGQHQNANNDALQAVVSRGVTPLRDIKSAILGEYSLRTKFGLARSACSASETLAEYPGKAILNAQTAIAMEQVGKTADRVFGWSAERAKPLVQIANVTLPSAAEREDREKAHRALDDIARALRLRD
jgi:hypothetical protein